MYWFYSFVELEQVIILVHVGKMFLVLSIL